MKAIFITLLILSSVGAYAVGPELSKRAPSWRTVMDEPSDDVPEGKTQVKLVIHTPGTKLEVQYPGTRSFVSWGTLDSSGKVVMMLDTGNHAFRLTKIGYEETYRHVKLKSGHYFEASVYLHKPRPRGVKKPAVYVYNDEAIDFNLQIEPVGEFVFTYPEYNKEGWNISLDSDNNLTCDGKAYDYLFWEGQQMNMNYNEQEGFVVSKTEVISFLEDKLSVLGFNDKEQNDFIAYWGPILSSTDHNYIHFIQTANYNDEVAGYKSTAKIDSELRIFMIHEPCDQFRYVEAQQLKTFERNGLTLVEWGGGSIPSSQKEF